jgi:hypothetical protein
MSGTSSEKQRLDSTREELREAGLPRQPSVWLRANSGRRSMIETMATAWPKSRSYDRRTLQQLGAAEFSRVLGVVDGGGCYFDILTESDLMSPTFVGIALR